MEVVISPEKNLVIATDLDLSSIENGEYQLNIRFKDSEGKFSSIISKNIEKYTLGNDDFESFKMATIYPNPVDDILHVEAKELLEMKIYYSNGILVKTTLIKEGNQNLDFSNYKKGLYIVKFHSKKSNNIEIIKLKVGY